MADKKQGKKRLHLHEVRSEQAHDGSIVHHHTYKESKEDHMTQPERRNVATSGNADEAAEHIRDAFAQNQMGEQQAQPGEGGEQQAGEQPQPQAGTAE